MSLPRAGIEPTVGGLDENGGKALSHPQPLAPPQPPAFLLFSPSRHSWSLLAGSCFKNHFQVVRPPLAAGHCDCVSPGCVATRGSPERHERADLRTKEQRGHVLRPRSRIMRKRKSQGWDGGGALRVGVGPQGRAQTEAGTETFLGSSRAKPPGRGCSVPRLPFTLLQSQ